MMERLMAINDQIPLSPYVPPCGPVEDDADDIATTPSESLTRFHSRTPPGISILDYLRRIVRFTKAERSCLLITLHYIDQVVARMPIFVLSSLTCHRFVIAAIAVSSKCLCDTFSSNSMYAKVGGIPVGEFNVLERELLRMIDWRLTSTREVLQEYYVSLVRTYSKGTYYISDPLSSSGISSDSDMDYDATPSPSASPPPAAHPDPHAHVAQFGGSTGSPSAARREPSAILIDPATLPQEAPPPPTVEQNMAFAAFQQEQQEQQQQQQQQQQQRSGAAADMDTS
ncbi:hypothetical protein BN946_scf184976.g18 [Trametes cinnabarina]|uniref:Cyclin-domain-containing protein n=1 Tax=Pycnoporus cinnabarinus TaxID=5643 RepID=A0A060SAL8_PYCCI|nr:hypothetical protein BN946_scf184976.g18 [Trametes cinnabarina]